MPALNTYRLILIEADVIEFQGKEGKVQKAKYKFLQKPDEDGKPKFKIAYGDPIKKTFFDQVQNVELKNGWDDSKAKNYVFEIKEFDGETRETLREGDN